MECQIRVKKIYIYICSKSGEGGWVFSLDRIALGRSVASRTDRWRELTAKGALPLATTRNRKKTRSSKKRGRKLAPRARSQRQTAKIMH